MVYELSRGAIEEICRGGNPTNPVVQVLGYKKIPGGPTERYRILLSDGVHTHSSAMLANQLNGMISDNQLEGFTVIRLDKYVCNDISPDKRVVIVLDVTVLQTASECGQKIGNPQAFNKSAAAQNGINELLAQLSQLPQANLQNPQGVSANPHILPTTLPISSIGRQNVNHDIPIAELTNEEFVDYLRRGYIDPRDGLIP